MKLFRKSENYSNHKNKVGYFSKTVDKIYPSTKETHLLNPTIINN